MGRTNENGCISMPWMKYTNSENKPFELRTAWNNDENSVMHVRIIEWLVVDYKIICMLDEVKEANLR